jgi:hypothetical protein
MQDGGEVSPSVSHALASDDAFDRYFAARLKGNYEHDYDFQLMFALYNFFSKGQNELSLLLEKDKHIPGGFLLQGTDGVSVLKPLSFLFIWTRQRVFSEVERQTLFTYKISRAMKGLMAALFPGRYKKEEKMVYGKSKTLVKKYSSAAAGKTEKQEDRSVRRQKQKVAPKDYRMVQSEEQLALISNGKSMEDYLSVWNRRLGRVAMENKEVVDSFIQEKLVNIKYILMRRSRFVDIDQNAIYIAQHPRFQTLSHKEALFSYIRLFIFYDLEAFARTNRFKIDYIVRK